MLLATPESIRTLQRKLSMPRPSKSATGVMQSMVECTGATPSVALVNVGWANAHALA